MYWKGKTTGILGSLLALLAALSMAGCSPINAGWDAFKKDDFAGAKAKWQEAKDEEAKVLLEKVDVAMKIVEMDASAKANYEKGKTQTANQERINITLMDKWADKKNAKGEADNWLQQSKLLTDIMAESVRVRGEVQKSVQKQYNDIIQTGKDHFNNNRYQEAKEAFAKSEKVNTYKYITIQTEDVAALVEAAQMALDIQAEIERERREAEERARVEAERIAAERTAAIVAEEDRKRAAEEEKKRLWEEFLKKGKPFEPMVAVVGLPAKGEGYSKAADDREGFQGAARLPTVKKDKLKAEDIYSLEIVVPKTFIASDLRNKFEDKNDLLKKTPISEGDKRHYFTQGYSGGRFYLNVYNERSKEAKFKIEATIYKRPVTN